MQTALADWQSTSFGTPRTFRASDVRRALDAVKAALGPEAIILATREVGGSFFRPGEVEITAAIEPEEPFASPGSAHQRRKGSIPPRRDSTGDADESDDRPSLPSAPRLPFFASQMVEKLLDLGVERKVARTLTQRAVSEGAQGAADAERIIRGRIAHRLQVAPPPWARDKRRVVALVGPTGVGKTTTIGKLTARALIDSRMNVALITVDTYRICASDQLARYGDIMKVPTFVAADASQMARAMEKTAQADLVLIDSAGRSTEAEVLKQAQLLSTVRGVELYLTLSLTASARDLEVTADRYRSLNPSRIILTKVDEAVAPGGFLSAAVRLDRPVTCITNGQRVPEDVHSVTSSQLAGIVLGSTYAANA
jgi:flagellar biosynthesis protein FlhF